MAIQVGSHFGTHGITAQEAGQDGEGTVGRYAEEAAEYRACDAKQQMDGIGGDQQIADQDKRKQSGKDGVKPQKQPPACPSEHRGRK